MDWIPGQARNDVGLGLVVVASRFRVKPGMTWVWGDRLIYCRRYPCLARRQRVAVWKQIRLAIKALSYVPLSPPA